MEKPRFQVIAQVPQRKALHKFTIITSLSFGALQNHLKRISQLSEISVTYQDEEGDACTLTNEEEFTEAKRALDFGSILSLQLTVTAGENATAYLEPAPKNEAPKPQPTPRSSTTSRQRKPGYYPQLADELGEELHPPSSPTDSVAMNRNTQTTPDLTTSTTEWTGPFLSTASREITNVLDTLLKSVTAEPSSLLKTSSSTLCHAGILCKLCEKTIIGNRYKCGNCAEFDLCELCLLDPEAHDPTHILLLIRLPCPSAGYVKGRPVPMLQENIYHEKKAPKQFLDLEESIPSAFLDKKMRKAMKHEKKMKKMLPHHIEAQVKAMKSDIEFKRKEINDIRGKIKDTKKMVFSNCTEEEAAMNSTNLSAKIVRDNADYASVLPNSRVNYKWVVENDGGSFWSSVRFHCISGNMLSDERQISLPFCSAGDQIELEVPFTVPDTPGYYYSNWRLSHHGKAFGPPFKVECRVSVQQATSGKNVEVDSGAEDDEDLASADQGFAIKAFPGAGGMQQPLIAISHEDYMEDVLVHSLKVPNEDNDSIDLDATELTHQDDTPQSPLYSDQEFLPDVILNNASSPPIDILPVRTVSNVDTASIASSSADSFIVVQMPDSFDPDKPIYLSQGNETVPANVVPDSANEQSLDGSNEYPSLGDLTPPIVSSTSPTFVTHSPQPNVSVMSLASISPMSSLKSFVSSVVDKIDDSLTRSLTPKSTRQEELVSSCEDFKPFEIDLCASLPSVTRDSYTAPSRESSYDLSAPLALNLTPPTSDFKFEIASDDSFIAPATSNYMSRESKPILPECEEGAMWLSQSGKIVKDTQDDAKWIKSNQPFLLANDQEEAWIAPSSQWKPKAPNTPIERLMKMGFCNRDLNITLLEKHNGNLELVIADLLDESQAAWVK